MVSLLSKLMKLSISDPVISSCRDHMTRGWGEDVNLMTFRETQGVVESGHVPIITHARSVGDELAQSPR